MRPTITISDSAARRILVLRQIEPESMLRIEVIGGGCAGFQYRFSLETRSEEEDSVFEHEGAYVILDPCSLSLLDGGRVEFIESVTASSFQVIHPHLKSSCGCGLSFSL